MSTQLVGNADFLESMFAEALPGAHTKVCSFRVDPSKADRFDWCGRPWSPTQRLPAWFDRGNSYVTLSMFEPDPRTGEMHRRKADFVSLHAVMMDDLGSGLGSKVPIAKLLLDPSAMIETSPHNFQAYLFLVQNADTRDRALCERLIERLIDSGLTADGRDPGQAGVTRYGRLPVGINSKAKYVEKLGGAPFAVRLASFNPARRYTLRQIAETYRLDLAPAAPRQATVVPINTELMRTIDVRFTALLRTLELMRLYRGRIGNGPWHEITCPWIDMHTDRADSGTALADPSAENNFTGGFKCHHGHCEDRTMRDIWRWVRELSRSLEERRSRGN